MDEEDCRKKFERGIMAVKAEEKKVCLTMLRRTL